MGKLKSVLLVDDDDTTNFLNTFFINQVDTTLEVNVVQNGKEAIDFNGDIVEEEGEDDN